MDPLTHGLIGAAASQSFADEEQLRAAGLIGAAAAMLPDLDVLIRSSSDPLLTLEYHRQFTHAIAFIPVGALLVACVFWWAVKSKMTFKKTYLFSLAGIATAGMADLFTSYGVHLFWPLTDERFAWNLISVIDPLFSLGLILAVGISLYKRNKNIACAAFIWMTVYLLFALTQKQEAKIAAQALAQQRNHFIERLIVKPTFGNEILWSIRYKSGNRLYADGVRLVPFGSTEVYRGESTPLLDWQQRYSSYSGSVLYRDIRRFADLSEGILVTHPDYPDVIGDGRYAMLPTSIEPLWGIVIDTTRPNRHVEFSTYRDASTAVRNSFLDMLMGR